MSEPVVVPRGSADGDGWLLAVAWRAREEARDVARGLVATVRLPSACPSASTATGSGQWHSGRPCGCERGHRHRRDRRGLAAGLLTLAVLGSRPSSALNSRLAWRERGSFRSRAAVLTPAFWRPASRSVARAGADRRRSVGGDPARDAASRHPGRQTALHWGHARQATGRTAQGAGQGADARRRRFKRDGLQQAARIIRKEVDDARDDHGTARATGDQDRAA